MSEPVRAAGGGWKLSLVAALLGVLIGAGAMFLASGQFVRSYLLDHPEVIPEAMERLRSREMANAVGQNRAAFETPFHSAWAGAADGDVVLVEFYDYACGFCRTSNADIERLMREDPRLKVVWREYPVLGPGSEQAAVASLAAARAGRFRQFHDGLFGAGRPTPENVTRVSQSVGLGAAELTDEFRREIQRNYELARAIGANGTPVFIVGDQVFHGAVGYETLKAAIATARAAS